MREQFARESAADGRGCGSDEPYAVGGVGCGRGRGVVGGGFGLRGEGWRGFGMGHHGALLVKDMGWDSGGIVGWDERDKVLSMEY